MTRGARLTAAAALAAAALGGPAQALADDGPVTGPLARAGAWLTDDQGRVVVVHGVNVLKKVAPFYRREFGEQDARFLADEGFTAARIGYIWAGAEPEPGRYDEAYLRRVADLDALLGRYGIRTLVDFHHDFWSEKNGGDGAPAWATLGMTMDDSFAHFWRDDPAPDGAGVQTHFVEAWRRAAEVLRDHANVLGFDPLNEPYPGSDYPPPCGDFTPCAEFESGALAAMYRRVIGAIRSAGAGQVIWPEGIAQNGLQAPALPRFEDPQTAFSFHYYCPATQSAPGDFAPLAAACAPHEERGIETFLAYARATGVPAFLGEFSCNDVSADNAQIVDRMDRAFTSWTIWAYYTAADDPADCSHQGLLVDDAKPGSEDNAKQAKLDALVVPYPQAIAGTPRSYDLDRSTRTMTLRYDTAAPGARLAPGAVTQVFVPARMYPHGYTVEATGARIVSAPSSPWLRLAAEPGATTVTAKVTPASGGATERPLQTGALPVAAVAAARRACASRRSVLVHLRGVRGSQVRRVVVDVDGVRQRALRGARRAVRVTLAGHAPGVVRVRLVIRLRSGRTRVDRRTYRVCA